MGFSGDWLTGSHLAGGKVILLGEHAVVYGKPALVVGGRKGARARARQAEVSSLCLGERRYCLSSEVAEQEPLPAKAFRALLEVLGSAPVQVETQLEIPAGMGLGASAALAVAVARAVAAVERSSLTKDKPTADISDRQLLEAANAWEGVFHGNASGVDTAAAFESGCLWFSRAAGALPLKVSIMPRLVVAVADRAASTRAMVQWVARERSARPLQVDEYFSVISGLTEEAKQGATSGDWKRVGNLMTQNHEVLQALGLSTPKLDDACRIARMVGVHGVKLTGAGGGGCVVALSRSDSTFELIEAWTRAGYQSFEFS